MVVSYKCLTPSLTQNPWSSQSPFSYKKHVIFVISIRRSGPISEQFCFNIEYGTALEKIQLLRDKM